MDIFDESVAKKLAGHQYDLVDCGSELETAQNQLRHYLEMTASVPGDTLYARLVYMVNLYDISEEEAGIV